MQVKHGNHKRNQTDDDNKNLTHKSCPRQNDADSVPNTS